MFSKRMRSRVNGVRRSCEIAAIINSRPLNCSRSCFAHRVKDLCGLAHLRQYHCVPLVAAVARHPRQPDPSIQTRTRACASARRARANRTKQPLRSQVAGCRSQVRVPRAAAVVGGVAVSGQAEKFRAAAFTLVDGRSAGESGIPGVGGNDGNVGKPSRGPRSTEDGGK